MVVNLLPEIFVVANLLAIRTNGDQSLQLLNLRQGLFQLLDTGRQTSLQLDDARANPQPCAQFSPVKRLCEVIVSTSFRPLNNVFLPASESQQDQIDGHCLGPYTSPAISTAMYRIETHRFAAELIRQSKLFVKSIESVTLTPASYAALLWFPNCLWSRWLIGRWLAAQRTRSVDGKRTEMGFSS
jgi:hypothetical protein